jgi:hypothetical protein
MKLRCARRRSFISLTIAVCVTTSYFLAGGRQRKWSYQELLQSTPQQASHSLPADKEISQRYDDKKRFDSLLLSPTSNHLHEIATFLNSPHELTRLKAARLLGQSENPAFLSSLKSAFKQHSQEKTKVPVAIRLAIAQIETRDMKGKSRIEAVAKAVGITLPELKNLFAKINESSTAYNAVYGKSDGRVVVDVITDLMVKSAFQGANVQEFIDDWVLLQLAKLRIRSAMLPEKEGADLILNTLRLGAGFDVATGSILEEHLIENRPRAADRILIKLEDMVKRPEIYAKAPYSPEAEPIIRKYGLRHAPIFRAAGSSKDKRMLALLRKFAQGQVPPTDKEWIRKKAREAMGVLQPRIPGSINLNLRYTS